jgi:hypothetical protein
LLIDRLLDLKRLASLEVAVEGPKGSATRSGASEINGNAIQPRPDTVMSAAVRRNACETDDSCALRRLPSCPFPED